VSPISLLNDFAVAIHERNIFKDLKEYNSDDNLVASDAVISDDGADF
jgi:hypothetical protein